MRASVFLVLLVLGGPDGDWADLLGPAWIQSLSLSLG